MKQYYWAENLENYKSDNEPDFDQIIEIKRLNFFIGRNNAGKSRFLRELFINSNHFHNYENNNPKDLIKEFLIQLKKVDHDIHIPFYDEKTKKL